MTERLTCELVGERGLVERYVAGRLREATELASFEAHVVGCSQCQDEVRLGMTVRAALANPRARSASRLWLGGGLAIAAGIAALLVVRSGGDQSGDASRGTAPYRGPTGSATLAPRPIAPNGSVEARSAFVWSRAPGTDRYRVVVFAPDGAVRWEAQTSDTAITLPDSVSLLPNVAYAWKVWARTSWDRWTGSELTEFSVRAPSR